MKPADSAILQELSLYAGSKSCAAVFDESDLIPISHLEHYAYCPRQAHHAYKITLKGESLRKWFTNKNNHYI